MTRDLYGDLGVPRGADAAAIRRAYRRAAKHAHPDMPGGSGKRFALIKVAHDTLTDDARRRHYDETGEVEEKPPDNARAEAMQCVATALEAVLAECQSGNRDPMTVDLADKMRGWIRVHLAESHRQVGQIQDIIGKNEKLGLRFKGDLMQQIISGRVMMLRERIANIEKNERSGKAALDLLGEVSFTADRPPPAQPGINMAALLNQMGRF
jgi:curved DNA-binding protein CbpA